MTSAGTLVIANNDALLNLNGLENVRYLGELILDDNALLESITAFEKLQTVDYGVAIINNYDLTRCAIDFFCDSLFHPFLENQIFYNGPSCNSLDEILASCNITGLNEMYVLENISVFPNPSTGSFYLQFDSKENSSGKIELLDQRGTVLLTEKFDVITGNRFYKTI